MILIDEFWYYSDEEIIEYRNELNEELIYLRDKIKKGELSAWTIQREESTLEFLNGYIKKHIDETN